MTDRSWPWYQYFRENFNQAIKYLLAFENIIDSDKYSKVFQAYQDESLAQFIFESNTLEQRGLSRGQTKDLVFYGLKDPNIPRPIFNIRSFQDYYNVVEPLNLPVDFGVNILRNSGLPNNGDIKINADGLKYYEIAKYGKNNREAMAVTQHFLATLKSETLSISSLTNRYKREFYKRMVEALASDNPVKIAIGKELQNRFFPDCLEPEFNPIITEDQLKDLHSTLAQGLIEGTVSRSGEYRKQPIMTDYESHYPSPDEVPDAMRKFFEEFKTLEEERHNPIHLATWASSQFVLIHPFSDFNGRISRLLINLILRSYRLPFWISMRSNKVERKKYFDALKHLRRGKRLSMASLISIHIINNFQDINKMLALSGYPLITTDNVNDLPMMEEEILFNLIGWKIHVSLD